MSLIRRLARDDRATTGLEYGLILSVVAVVVALVLTSIDINTEHIGSMFGQLVGKL